MLGIPASFYASLFYWGTFVLCVLYSLKIYNYDGKQLIQSQNNLFPALILTVFLILLIGLRPYDQGYFGDTVNYNRNFFEAAENPDLALYDLYKEGGNDWIFRLLMIFCARTGNIHLFYFIIALVYFGGSLWACNRIFPNNPYAALLIVIASFSFYVYGINGIRNGMACSLICVAISYADGNLKDKIIAGILCFMAIGIHNSTSLPTLMLFISVFFIKDFRWALFFWIASIFISLFAGGAISSFFETLGFDDRFSRYLEGAEDEETMDSFSHRGFRWDFLFYSCVPIVIGWYVVIKKGMRNRIYELLLNTYTLSNAFWVMVIRAAFSNRFAYLSWFIYPLVLAYPFLKMNVWENQGNKVALVVMGNIIFTLIL